VPDVDEDRGLRPVGFTAAWLLSGAAILVLFTGFGVGVVLIHNHEIGAGVGVFFGGTAAGIACVALGWGQVAGDLSQRRVELLDARLELLAKLLEAQLEEQAATNERLDRLLARRQLRWWSRVRWPS
jgi:hypothetical protein